MKSTFVSKHPYLAAIFIGLLCTFITGLGVAIPQILQLNENLVYEVATLFLLFSIGVGIVIMMNSKSALADYGFRKSQSSYKVFWYIPLLLIEVLPIVVFGFASDITVKKVLIFLIFTVAVGFNEEIYFRGLALKCLEGKGRKKAIIYSSIIFGVLHLVNALNGKDTLYLVLQMIFAFLVGFVLAEIVSITKSLWIVILWHGSHDFISNVTQDSLDKTALIILGIQVVVLCIYAICIWNKSNEECRLAQGLPDLSA